MKQLFANLRPGNLPYELFSEIARLTVTPVVELVAFKRVGNTIRVLLVRRPEDDQVWPGMFHIPGSIILPTDATHEDALHRIISGKFAALRIAKPAFVTLSLCATSRGTELALVYCAEVQKGSSAGQWYNVDDLPDSLIEGHAGFISAAAQSVVLARGMLL